MDARKVEARPPIVIEQVVRPLVPPAAREEVLGDLSERYRSPIAYIADALATVPFVIASQIRRSSSLPVLGLQAFILFACLGGFAAAQGDPPMWLRAGIPAAAASLGLVLRDAYRTTDRPDIGRAIVDGLTAAACVALTHGAIYVLQGAFKPVLSWMLPGPLLMLGILAPLMLCLLRFGVDGDDRTAPAGGMTCADLANAYARFQRRTRRRNVAELVIGIACMAFASFYLWRFQPAVAPFGWAMMIGHGIAMICIATMGWVRDMPRQPASGPLLSQYQRELSRLRHIRQYLWWWYLVPMFVGITTNLIAPGISASDATRILAGGGACLLLGLCIAGLNHDRGRRVQEKIDGLEQLRVLSG